MFLCVSVGILKSRVEKIKSNGGKLHFHPNLQKGRKKNETKTQYSRGVIFKAQVWAVICDGKNKFSRELTGCYSYRKQPASASGKTAPPFQRPWVTPPPQIFSSRPRPGWNSRATKDSPSQPSWVHHSASPRIQAPLAVPPRAHARQEMQCLVEGKSQKAFAQGHAYSVGDGPTSGTVEPLHWSAWDLYA